MWEKQLAHYTILDKIGEGGMGEVFRARDTRLGRTVALKFLPEILAADSERLARFQREAQVLASLNHPHIGAIHGFEHVDGKRFLVLELVEGEDMSQRLVRGPIAWQEALPLAHQIAEALEAAHEEGIVHRDLKPANIVITPTGNAKVLDFGLAKSWSSESTNTNLSNSPTILSNSPTIAGVIMGTAAYMSPEQARGQNVDRRADIFAFGCVLYEMLTGRQCFQGATVSDILAAVLRAEPNWDALPRDTPPAIVRLLRRCLDKDPRVRLRDIGEARIVLDRVLHGRAEEMMATAVAAPTSSSGRARFAWAIAAVFAATAAVLFFMRPEPGAPARLTRTSILPAEGVRFSLRGVHPGPVVISPQGERIVYAGRTGGQTYLYLRELDRLETTQLRGTEDAGYPFWSPDGRSIGFFAQGKLKRVEVSGGPPRTVGEAPVGKGGTWNKNGQILFAPTFTGPLHVVSENGGESRQVTEVRTDRGENSHRFPVFLDDGEHFLYLARHGGESNLVRVGSLSGGFDKELLRGPSNATHASGHLLFMRESSLMAQQLDAATFELRGEARPIADPVRFIPAAMCGVFSASQNGIVVYQPGAAIPGAQLLWRDRNGKEIGRIGAPEIIDTPALSNNGRYVAVDAFVGTGGTGDIWILDLERQVRSRFTFDTHSDENAVWSPDDKQIAFASGRNNKYGIYIKEFGGATEDELFLETETLVIPTDWTDDYIVYYSNDSLNMGQILAVPTRGERKPIPVAAGPLGEFMGRVSPDGHWLAYMSDESGSVEIYVSSFPSPGRKWQVSSGGGSQPFWDPRGRGIYYYGNQTGFLQFVQAEWNATSFAVGAMHQLFESPNASAFVVAPDGERFLLLEDVDAGGVEPLGVIMGWEREMHP